MTDGTIGEPEPGLPHDAAGDLRIARWLAAESLANRPLPELLAGFCAQLNAQGLAIARGHLSMTTVHPEHRGFYITWTGGEGLRRDVFRHEEQPDPRWLDSPLYYMLRERLTSWHRPLVGPSNEPDFPIFGEFREQGMTDYYAESATFGWTIDEGESGGFAGWHFDEASAHPVTDRAQVGLTTSWTTDRPRGFGAELARLKALLPLFYAAVKSVVLPEIAEVLLATYLGLDAGHRVLRGQVRRGSVDSIRAVIFLADLRGFTGLADRLPTAELVAMLDDYLDSIARPVERRGGQILKFLGDGLLAIFPLRDGPVEDACLAAAEAAEAALADNRRRNARRAEAGLSTMALDIALNLGEVLYGNVGSASRLDFTVIGPAVNAASRLEALCNDLDVNLLISKDFVAACPALMPRARSLGAHRLKGLVQAQEVFTLDLAGGAP